MKIQRLRKMQEREVAAMEKAWEAYFHNPTSKNYTEFNFAAGRASLAGELYDAAIERKQRQAKQQKAASDNAATEMEL